MEYACFCCSLLSLLSLLLHTCIRANKHKHTRKYNCKIVFLGTDVGHSFSYGHQKQQQTVAKLLQEQVVAPLKSLGYHVILGSECGKGSDTSVECATVDQILMASAKV
jgi:hypothetical protein